MFICFVWRINRSKDQLVSWFLKLIQLFIDSPIYRLWQLVMCVENCLSARKPTLLWLVSLRTWAALSVRTARYEWISQFQCLFIHGIVMVSGHCVFKSQGNIPGFLGIDQIFLCQLCLTQWSVGSTLDLDLNSSNFDPTDWVLCKEIGQFLCAHLSPS